MPISVGPRTPKAVLDQTLQTAAPSDQLASIRVTSGYSSSPDSSPSALREAVADNPPLLNNPILLTPIDVAREWLAVSEFRMVEFDRDLATESRSDVMQRV